MKRHDQNRRLRIARETLRALTSGSLARVAGGVDDIGPTTGSLDTGPKSTAWTGREDYDDGVLDRGACTLTA